jgi:DNA polymerase III alpha subunit (gram-positive type)
MRKSASSGHGEWMTGTPTERQTIGRDDQFDALSIRVPVHRDGHHATPVVVRKVKRTARLPQRTREMTFASLHHHTTFSYGDGYALPEAHIRRATEIGLNTVAATEHGNISSHVQMEGSAKKAGVKPVFGVELYTGELGENATQRKNHLTILAENQEGYANLLQLVTKTYSEGSSSIPEGWLCYRDAKGLHCSHLASGESISLKLTLLSPEGSVWRINSNGRSVIPITLSSKLSRS